MHYPIALNKVGADYLPYGTANRMYNTPYLSTMECSYGARTTEVPGQQAKAGKPADRELDKDITQRNTLA